MAEDLRYKENRVESRILEEDVEMLAKFLGELRSRFLDRGFSLVSVYGMPYFREKSVIRVVFDVDVSDGILCLKTIEMPSDPTPYPIISEYCYMDYNFERTGFAEIRVTDQDTPGKPRVEINTYGVNAEKLKEYVEDLLSDREKILGIPEVIYTSLLLYLISTDNYNLFESGDLLLDDLKSAFRTAFGESFGIGDDLVERIDKFLNMFGGDVAMTSKKILEKSFENCCALSGSLNIEPGKVFGRVISGDDYDVLLGVIPLKDESATEEGVVDMGVFVGVYKKILGGGVPVYFSFVRMKYDPAKRTLKADIDKSRAHLATNFYVITNKIGDEIGEFIERIPDILRNIFSNLDTVLKR